MQMLGNFGAKQNLCFIYFANPLPLFKKRSRATGQVEACALGRRPWEHINTFYSTIKYVLRINLDQNMPKMFVFGIKAV